MKVTANPAERIRDMTPEERREMLAEVSFPKLTEPRKERLSKLDDEQVMEALVAWAWIEETAKS